MPYKEFKLNTIKVFTGLQKRMVELSKNVNKDTDNIKKNQSELNNTACKINTHTHTQSRESTVDEIQKKVSAIWKIG